MSKHYLLNIAVLLKSDISLEDEAILNFMINGVGSIESIKDKMLFFTSEAEKKSLIFGYKKNIFVDGEYISIFWKNNLYEKNSGIRLVLPGIKDIQGWYESLKFVSWLCKLVKFDGLIGYIVDEENLCEHSFLYSLEGNLYFRDEKNLNNIVSFLTGLGP